MQCSLNFLCVTIKAARRRIQPWKSWYPVCQAAATLCCQRHPDIQAHLLKVHTNVWCFLRNPYFQLKHETFFNATKANSFPQALASRESRRSSNRWRSSTEQAFRTRRRGRTSSWSTRTSSWRCSPWSEPWTFSRSSMRTPLVRYVKETDSKKNKLHAFDKNLNTKKKNTIFLQQTYNLLVVKLDDYTKVKHKFTKVFSGKGWFSAVHRLRDCDLFWPSLCCRHQGPVEWPRHPGDLSRQCFWIFNASFAGVLWQTEGVSVDRFGKIVSSLTFDFLVHWPSYEQEKLIDRFCVTGAFLTQVVNTMLWFTWSSLNLEYKNLLSL